MKSFAKTPQNRLYLEVRRRLNGAALSYLIQSQTTVNTEHNLKLSQKKWSGTLFFVSEKSCVWHVTEGELLTLRLHWKHLTVFKYFDQFQTTFIITAKLSIRSFKFNLSNDWKIYNALFSFFCVFFLPLCSFFLKETTNLLGLSGKLKITIIIDINHQECIVRNITTNVYFDFMFGLPAPPPRLPLQMLPKAVSSCHHINFLSKDCFPLILLREGY